MRPKSGWVICAAALFALLVNSAQAALVTHEFSGVLTDVVFRGPDPFGGQIHVGTSFHGLYQFDDSQAPEVGGPCQADLVQCIRFFPIPPYRFELSIGDFVFEATRKIDIVVNNGQPGISKDFYSVTSNADVGPWLDVAMGLFLEDASLTAIDDPRQLFAKPPKLKDFSFKEFQINGGIDQGYFHGELDALKRDNRKKLP